jgi:hypothetical protein
MPRKCVQIVGQGIPARMSDDDAARIVREGDGQYCPKRVWKNFHDNNADERFRTRVGSRIDQRGRIVNA